MHPQWLIIQGLAPANDFTPSALVRVLPDARPPLQQPQFMPCPDRELRGSFALRSFTARARFTADDSAEIAGAPPMMRPDAAPHCGQAAGSRHCASGRRAANSPHAPQE